MWARVEVGIKQIINGLNGVLTAEQSPQIALETMAGKGTEIGRNFEELVPLLMGLLSTRSYQLP